MKFARSAIAGILLLLAASASAQQFPTIPYHSVIGRLGTPGTSGPSQAIPFATLLTQLFGGTNPLTAANNLSDVANRVTARGWLGLPPTFGLRKVFSKF